MISPRHILEHYIGYRRYYYGHARTRHGDILAFNAHISRKRERRRHVLLYWARLFIASVHFHRRRKAVAMPDAIDYYTLYFTLASRSLMICRILVLVGLHQFDAFRQNKRFYASTLFFPSRDFAYHAFIFQALFSDHDRHYIGISFWRVISICKIYRLADEAIFRCDFFYFQVFSAFRCRWSKCFLVF